MANTIAVDQSHRVSPKAAHVGLVRISVVSTETYATGSGGFTIDLAATLAALGISPLDILTVTGPPTLTGHVPSVTSVSAAGVATLRLWNGTAEIANGALTQTVRLNIFYSQGAAS